MGLTLTYQILYDKSVSKTKNLRSIIPIQPVPIESESDTKNRLYGLAPNIKVRFSFRKKIYQCLVSAAQAHYEHVAVVAIVKNYNKTGNITNQIWKGMDDFTRQHSQTSLKHLTVFVKCRSEEIDPVLLVRQMAQGRSETKGKISRQMEKVEVSFAIEGDSEELMADEILAATKIRNVVVLNKPKEMPANQIYSPARVYMYTSIISDNEIDQAVNDRLLKIIGMGYENIVLRIETDIQKEMIQRKVIELEKAITTFVEEHSDLSLKRAVVWFFNKESVVPM